eukprot:m.714125 g.714125  ORF g.714125 m.714125 type:complete len:374 (+) comp22971_c1_seq81:448-1569(+)
MMETDFDREPLLGSAACDDTEDKHKSLTSSQGVEGTIAAGRSRISTDVRTSTTRQKQDAWYQPANIWRICNLVFLGQFLSMLLCSTGVFTKLLILRGVDIPMTQNIPNYVLLSLVYVPQLVQRGQFMSAVKGINSRWYLLPLLAAFDVEANYVIVLAYQYTNFTSAQLLDGLATFFVLGLSWLLLGKRYSLLHYLGILVALVGMGGIIAADTLASDASDRAAGSNPLLGDMLCVTAAALYACSNVGEEYVVCQADKTHFLGMVGLFGAVLSAVQGAVLEHDRVRAIAWTPDIVALFVGYVASLFALYSLVPLLIARSSAMMFNLSMVSADFYSFLIGMFLFKSNFQMLYFVSFPVVLVGLGMYIKAPERIESS